MMEPSVTYVGGEPLPMEYVPVAEAIALQVGPYIYTIPAEHIPDVHSALARFIARSTRLKENRQ